jgi:hypothetical protein
VSFRPRSNTIADIPHGVSAPFSSPGRGAKSASTSTLHVQDTSKGKINLSWAPLASVASHEQTFNACHLLSAHNGFARE